MTDLTNSERIILAHEAGEWLTIAEATAIDRMLTTLRNDRAKRMLAETICESYDWYQDAHPEHLEFTGMVLHRCALIALGKGT